MSADDRIGVAQVVVRLGRGGAERVLVTLANALDPTRFDAHVITIRDAGELAGDLAPNVTLHALERRHAWDVASFRRFRRLLVRHGISVVHTHSHLAAYFVRIAHGLGPPDFRHVLHEHFPLIEESRLRFADRICLTRVDHCFAASPALARYASGWLKLSPSRCEVLPNPILAMPPPSPRPAPVFTVVQVGRVAEQKDQRMALAVAHRLRAALLPSFSWLVVGRTDSRYAERCRTTAAELGLGDVVTFTGETDDTSTMLEGAHVGVLTSRAEGLPLALLEYMAAGLPVVVTDTGQAGAVVRASGGGRVVPHGDVDGFAAAVGAYATDREAAARAGARNRAYVAAHHRVEPVVRRAAAVYTALATDGGVG